MPVKGSCLLFDTALKEKLFEAVELIAAKNLGAGKNASIGNVYREIRSKGLEVDLPTVGDIYIARLSSQNDESFSSESDVFDFTTRTYNDAIDGLVELNTLVGEKQIADEKPERAVVNFMLKALYDNLVTDARTTSDMKILQTALWNGMQRKLGKLDEKGKPTKKTMEDLISESLNLEQTGKVDVNGHINNIEDLFNYMRQELGKAIDDVRESQPKEGKEAEHEYMLERFNEYVKNLENASYKLLFRRQDALQVRDEALIKAGYGKSVNGKESVDWEKLAAYNGSVADLRRNAWNTFEQIYGANIADRLTDTLQNEFLEMRADSVEKQMNATEKYANEGKNRVFNDANYNSFLNGKTEAQWIKDEKVENVEDLHQKVNAELANKKYVPLVMKSIQQKITDFFTKNYAKVNAAEAQRAIDDILGIQTAIEWIKENGIQNQDELYAALDDALSGRNISAQNDLAIRGEFNRILDINNKAETELRNREARGTAPPRAKKSDIKRLVELYHLGIFNSQHDDLLYKLLGVDGLSRKDLHDLEAITSTMSDLARKMARPEDKGGYGIGETVYASREFQKLQRLIDVIIQRNINNKTKRMRVLSFISNYLNVMLSGLLSMPFTILQNVLSGVKSVLTGVRFYSTGNLSDWLKKSKQAFSIYFSMLKDVSATGQAYGEEIGSFATQELFLNSLKFNWKWDAKETDANNAKKIGRSVLNAATAHIRIGLLAFDSANKVAFANKVFYNIVYKGLSSHYKQAGVAHTPLDIAQTMNEMFYGQSFQDAKKVARKIAEESNASLPEKLRTKITDAYVVTLANDIVKANLSKQGILNDEMLEAAIKGSYHVAGIGLGHEPNNPFSKAIKGLRDNAKVKETKLIRSKEWNELARHKMGQIILNNFVIQFAGGATNWMVLRAKEGLGIGLFRLFEGRWNKDIDFINSKDIQREVRVRERDRNDIARSVVGAAYTGLFWVLGFGLTGGGGGDDDDKKKLAALNKKLKENNYKGDAGSKQKENDKDEIGLLENRIYAYQKIKESRSKNRMFKSLAPDLQLIAYYQDISKSKSFLEGLSTYVYKGYFNDDFSTSSKLKEAAVYMAQGDNNAALGQLTSIVGDRFSVPLYRGYKEYWRLASNLFREEKIPAQPYYPPSNYKDGLFAGGFLQDMGIYKGRPSITVIPGVGPAAYKRFKEKNITTLKDLNDGWFNMKDEDGFILNSAQRKQAEHFYNTIKEK